METVAPRAYRVRRTEFPLSITIVRKNTTGSAATTLIIGHVREMKNGQEISERDVNVNNAQGVLTYSIDRPQSTGSVEIVQTLLGFFATAEKDTARFEATIESTQGDSVSFAIRRPTINPGTATIKIQVP